jgi:hypothetical protein
MFCGFRVRLGIPLSYEAARDRAAIYRFCWNGFHGVLINRGYYYVKGASPV